MEGARAEWGIPWKGEYVRGEGIAPARRWSSLAETRWTILGGNGWPAMGEFAAKTHRKERKGRKGIH